MFVWGYTETSFPSDRSGGGGGGDTERLSSPNLTKAFFFEVSEKKSVPNREFGVPNFWVFRIFFLKNVIK